MQNNIISDNFPTVKNIIFDLGNVILDVDPQATIKEFAKRGATNFDNFPKQILDDFEKGIISAKDFVKLVKKHIPEIERYSSNMIASCWNAMLGEWSIRRLNILLHLKKNYKLFLLSNTNEIHVRKFLNTLRNASGHYINNYFEMVYFSNEVGMRKPELEIYQKVLLDNGLIPGECLYIDDLIENIQPAQQLGVHTLHFEKGKITLEDMFPEIEE